MSQSKVSHSAESAEELPPFLTTEEFAERFRMPVSTARYLRHAGKGPPSFRVGKRVLYAREDVLAWETELRQEQPA